VLFGQELENSTGCRSRVVDQNIDATKRGVPLFNKGFGIGRLRQISRYRNYFAVGLAGDLRRRGLQRLFATGADRDVDTLPSQRKGDRLADAGARSGDECGLPGHLEIHVDAHRLETAITPLTSAGSTSVSIDCLPGLSVS